MKTIKTCFIIFIGFLSFSANAQTLVLSENFDTYDGTTASVPAGWFISWNHAITPTSFYSSGTYSGLAPNSYKFGNTGDSVMTPLFSNADSLSFWTKGATISPLSTLSIYGTTDSFSWS